jgi:hypothetical protein
MTSSITQYSDWPTDPVAPMEGEESSDSEADYGEKLLHPANFRVVDIWNSPGSALQNRSDT